MRRPRRPARQTAETALTGLNAAPDGRFWHEESGDAGLGTSGSGDARAGVVAGLLGRGADRAQAACWGAYAHAVGGQRLSQRFGRSGFLAREIVGEVASTIASV
ncbi:NAD(P)H-hydrate dehydratase [Actinoplanes sp. CA-142083]|uniref:NAD(P)H-hydrate dehydratase n=1 Tax=Actinoplanes sp. CA-142083 TaxID=3239903 RepID=UPI003D93488E